MDAPPRVRPPGFWTFQAKASQHYPQAWAFVHFLRNGGRNVEEHLDDLLDALEEGATKEEALQAAFGEVDWGELEREFRVYVSEL